MSYATIEAAVVSVIQAHANYDTSNCKAGDVSPIKKGYSRVCRVLYGGGTREEVSLRCVQHTWTINLDVYVPYRGDIPTLEASLATERQTIIDQLALYPKLNACSGVIDAEITNGDKPEPLNTKRSAYRGQRLYLKVEELVTPSRVE